MTVPRLCAPAYELGEFADKVAELPELLAAPELADALTHPDAGFETYWWSEADIVELMSAAARRTLAGSGVAGSEVDTVLVASDSLPRDRSAQRRVAELQEETGTTGATVLTLGLMDCATAMVAVGSAASLVRDGTARNVLVVTGDLADRATGGHRIVAGGAAIASDAAATALVSAVAPGLPVLAMAHHAAPEPGRDTSRQQQLVARIRAHRELFARLEARYPFRRDAVARLLPSNFARNVVRLYLSDVGFTEAQLALGNVGRIAHCLGSDPLVNLADRLAAGPGPGPGDPLGHYLLMGSGISHLGAVLLDARPVPAA
ncbi:acyl carrier protein [Streptacidiphilus sp. P02-A3a]|uniref:acyl carrier protein n=1 Tax=Streptacidiphilus sp. P02-A3a TaxID=2704468 RepID=UPI0015FDA29B|nr:acyl carrier protein [Streptacidiphilus sp. P02-A3a]QMU71300.1 acyl carrier protein [Streptacidiphilus sp. P02-A3a]